MVWYNSPEKPRIARIGNFHNIYCYQLWFKRALNIPSIYFVAVFSQKNTIYNKYLNTISAAI